MSTVAKIAAAVLALVALGLGYAAFMLATRPAPPPPKPVAQRASAALPTYPWWWPASPSPRATAWPPTC